MSNTKSFMVNGYQYITNHDLTLFELLNYFNYNSSLFVVEYNNLVCDKETWNKTKIQTNDRIEIVTIVGGG